MAVGMDGPVGREHRARHRRRRRLCRAGAGPADPEQPGHRQCLERRTVRRRSAGIGSSHASRWPASSRPAWRGPRARAPGLGPGRSRRSARRPRRVADRPGRWCDGGRSGAGSRPRRVGRPVHDPEVAAERPGQPCPGVGAEVGVLVDALGDQWVRDLEQQRPRAGAEEQRRLAVEAPGLGARAVEPASSGSSARSAGRGVSGRSAAARPPTTPRGRASGGREQLDGVDHEERHHAGRDRVAAVTCPW